MPHTPGPWNATIKDSPLASHRIYAADMQRIGEICNSRDTEEESKANARLVAAAPDLLEAMERCLPFIDDAEDIAPFYPDSAATTDCRTAVTAARAAIAKARDNERQKPNQ